MAGGIGRNGNSLSFANEPVRSRQDYDVGIQTKYQLFFSAPGATPEETEAEIREIEFHLLGSVKMASRFHNHRAASGTLKLLHNKALPLMLLIVAPVSLSRWAAADVRGWMKIANNAQAVVARSKSTVG